MVVHSQDAGGAGYQAGLRVGDLIMAVGGRQVVTHQEAVAAVDACERWVEMKVWGLRPSRTLAIHRAGGVLGVSLMNNERGPGVLLCEVGEGAQAYRLGLREGDAILSVSGQVVAHHSMACELMDASRQMEQTVEVVYVPATDEAPEPILRDMEA